MGLIISGSILIVLQFLADIGNVKAGGLTYFQNVTNFAAFVYDLLSFIAYSFIGGLGVIFLIIGIKHYRKRNEGNVDRKTTTSNDNKIEETIPSNDENIEDVPVTQDDTLLVKETEKESPSKQFCRKCGNEIDPTTKRCTGCDKQYFKGFKYYISVIFTKKRILPIALSVMLIISVICNIALSSRFNDYYDMYVDQHEVIMEYWSKLQFYEEYVVVVSDDGTNLYHKYGCEDFNDSSFWAYNVNQAKNMGYVPHKRCCS